MPEFFLWLAAGYFGIGLLTAAVVLQEPYDRNPWWAIALLWPLVWMKR